jgi:hypothetical protein
MCLSEEVRRSNLLVNFQFPFRQVYVSLRGGTTKQPAYRQAGLLVFAECLLLKFIKIAQLFMLYQLLGRGYRSNLADCFVVPPRKDTFILGF